METSPLTLQARPDVFQQKVVSLYEELFSVRCGTRHVYKSANVGRI